MNNAHYKKRIEALQRRAAEQGIPVPRLVVLHIYHDDWCPGSKDPDRLCLCSPGLAIENGETGETLVSDLQPPASPAPKGAL